MTRPPYQLCFVALNAYPAIDPLVQGPIGGMETRAWMLARALAGTGRFHVEFVVRHTAALRKTEFEGVKLRPIVDRLYRIRESVSTRVERKRGFPFLRFKSITPSLLWQMPLLTVCRPFRRGPAESWTPVPVYTTSPPHIYCTFGVHGESSRVMASSRSVARPTVLFIAHDSDLDERYVEGSTFINLYGDKGHDCWRILKKADHIVCQTPWQQETLKSRFGREAMILNNPIDVEQWEAGLRSPDGNLWSNELAGWNRYLLWVGRSERVYKQPQLFGDLLRELPQAKGLMILNARDDAFESELRRSAPDNLRIISHVPFPEMPQIFSRAAALVNTSSLEGFPNVFLQAALSRVPVVSLQVGASFLSAARAGFDCAGNWAEFTRRAQQAWERPCGDCELDRARSNVIESHSLPRVIERLSNFLASIVES